MDEMSISETEQTIKKLQEDIQKLRYSQIKCKEEVDAIKKTIDTPNNSVEKSNYTDKSYWDERYKTKRDYDSGYEWYLCFNDIIRYINQDIQQCLKNTSKCENVKVNSAKILVAGCGNSLLCEDLVNYGYQNIVGVDYSDTVIKNMIKRCEDKKLKADMRSMDENLINNYDCVIDKGTLDAIASGGDDEENSSKLKVESEDAARYMSEVWRVMKKNGVFIVISTMPPDIFKAIAIDPIDIDCKGDPATDWGRGSKSIKLQTSEGSDIYYHCVSKLREVSQNILSSAKQSQQQQSQSKEQIMDGIMQLLEEAKKAKDLVEKAIHKQKSAKEEYEDAENKRKKLEKKLEVNNLMDLKVKEMIKQSNNFEVVVNFEGSFLESNGFVMVEYMIASDDGGEDVSNLWKEDDDMLCLVCGSSESLSLETNNDKKNLPSSDRVMYLKEESQCYESFEYTEKPMWVPNSSSSSASRDGKYVGKFKIPLPAYCGVFHISYNRVIHINGSAPSSYKLAQSKEFLVKSPIHNSTPDDKYIHNSNQKIFNCKRRGGKIMTNSLCSLVDDKSRDYSLVSSWEDLKNIKTFNISIVLISYNNSFKYNLNRVMMWIFNVDDKTKVIIETDLIISNNDHAISSSTIYCELLLNDAQVNINNLNISESWISLDQTGCIGCRIPYFSSNELESVQYNFDDLQNLFVTAECKFCRHKLLNTTIESLKQLPTGIFDNMMQDFICCEDFPSQAMTTNDVATSINPHNILFGSLFIVVNPLDLVSPSLLLQCKSSPTLLDTLTPCGGSIATTPTSKTGGANGPGGFTAIVNIDTCLVNCARCLSYLGDANITSEKNCDESCAHENVSNVDVTTSFRIEEMSDVKLCNSNVIININDLISSKQLNELINVDIEKIICRTMIHFNSVYGLSGFCLYISDKISTVQSNSLNQVIVLKLISKDYRFASCSSDNRKDCMELNNALKVSYSLKNTSEWINSSSCDAKIPLQYHEYGMMCAILNKRKNMLKRSMFNGQVLSVLYL